MMSWLVVFNVLNTRNRWVYQFCDFLNKATNPVVMRLRRFIPPMGGIDLTPMVMMFGIYVLQGFLYSLLR
ncbi:MAG: YggT family protein [Proteobacteria bacterium]|nr:YggT family protein [Pseudomonadota bacterium]